jgi:2-phosphosulfolactate phosphatase
MKAVIDRRVAVGAGPPCARRFGRDDAVIVVDVIRATTTAITAVALGRRCLPAPSLAAARALARALAGPRGGARQPPLLVGELEGAPPVGFDLTNSPAAIAGRTDVERPMVLLSSSGTRLMHAVAGAGAIYPACLRNQRAVAEHVLRRHRRVTVLGAASRGEFREEDRLCCARIAAHLVRAGFAVDGASTDALLARWADAPTEALLGSQSVTYLRRTGQLADLEFILGHVDDLDAPFELAAGEIRPCWSARPGLRQDMRR